MIRVRSATPQDWGGCNGCSSEVAPVVVVVGPPNARHATRLCGECASELEVLLAERGDAMEPDFDTRLIPSEYHESLEVRAEKVRNPCSERTRVTGHDHLQP